MKFFLLPIFLLAVPAQAVPLASDLSRFRACSQVARTLPERGIAVANGWRIEGGGSAARHCLALAQFQKGDHDAALASFEAAATLAQSGSTSGSASGKEGTDAARALWTAGANAALLAARPEPGLRFVLAALALKPVPAEAAALQLLRAEALVDLKREAEGLAAIDAALALDPTVPSGWLLKATLARQLGNFAVAQAAVLEAGKRTAPDNEMAFDVQFEAGAIAWAQGKKDLARAAWTAAASGNPEWPAVKAAEAALKVE
jgi:tetratricopeptide (TPR) repeat protein